jgi:hypothetical protein
MVGVWVTFKLFEKRSYSAFHQLKRNTWWIRSLNLWKCWACVLKPSADDICSQLAFVQAEKNCFVRPACCATVFLAASNAMCGNSVRPSVHLSLSLSLSLSVPLTLFVCRLSGILSVRIVLWMCKSAVKFSVAYRLWCLDLVQMVTPSHPIWVITLSTFSCKHVTH